MIPGFKLFISEREESERPPRHEVKRRACSQNFIRARLASVAGVFVSGRVIAYAARRRRRRRSEVTLLFRALTADLPHLRVLSLHLPLLPPVGSPLFRCPRATRRSLPPSWRVSQLTIRPTRDPRRPGSTAVQAVTG